MSVLAGCGRARLAQARSVAPPPPLQASLPALRPVSAVERQAYAGSGACTACHPAEAAEAASHHARTLAPVAGPDQLARFRAPGAQHDAALDMTFRPGVLGGRGVLLARRGRRNFAATADYAVGSGNRGVTYLSRGRGGTVELRLSYYHDVGHWDFSPHQPQGARTETPVGRRVDPPEEIQCFVCHSTALVTTNGGMAPKESILGIGCERCHGPGRAHIEAVRRGERDRTMIDLARDRKRITMELCDQCHTSPLGDDLGNPTVASNLARLQGPALALSACFQKSDLSCVTCHDPHHDIPHDSATRFNRICASCHTPASATQKACPVQPRGDCVRCHMPLQRVDMATGPLYHNHWIGIWAPGTSSAPRTRSSR